MAKDVGCAAVARTDCAVVTRVKLPGAERARIDWTKLVAYLLSMSHLDGRSKAAFFGRFGFRPEAWELLAVALRLVAVSNPVASVVESPYGTRVAVDGALAAPDGRSPMVRTIWIKEADAPPRLVTAYPL